MRKTFYLASTSTSNLAETMKICGCTLPGVRHPNYINLHHSCSKEERGNCPGFIQTLHPLEHTSYKQVESCDPTKEKIVNNSDHQRQLYLAGVSWEEMCDENNFRVEQDLLRMTELFNTEVDVHFTTMKEDSEYMKIVKKLRNVFINALFDDAKKYCVGDMPGEIPKTRGQRQSEVWRAERSIRFPASMAKSLLKLPQIDYARVLKEHLWTLLPATDSVYGIEMEKKAREDYIKWAQSQDETIVVHETGMWINPAFPQLSCSPDGIVRSPKSPPKLLEIKCPEYMKNATNFTDIESCFSNEDDWSNFCLQRNGDGSLSLKKTSSYWFQVQVSLGILKFEESHFMVWSPNGFIVVTVKFDPDWWESHKKRLIQLHGELWVPEYFLMRIPRFLRPLRIPLEME